MAKPGRRSAAEVDAAATAAGMNVVKVSDDRLVAPEHLTDEQRQEWDAIVNSLPANYFRPGDVSLLAAYCVASALYKEAALLLQLEGITLFAGEGRRERQYAHPAVTILTSQASAMAQMAQKLRLCPSSRMRIDRAKPPEGQGASTKTGAKKPWDDDGEEPGGAPPTAATA